MFVFSQPHDWQGDPAVQQILVFPNQEMKDLFDREMEERKEKAIENKTDVNDVSDSNAGAIYKLRAVRNSDGRWIPILRCGNTGGQLWEDNGSYLLSGSALIKTMEYLRDQVDKDIAEIMASDALKKASETSLAAIK